MTFGEFWRKYKVLSESSNSMSGNLPVEKLKSAVQDLLEELDLDQTAVRLGNTQVGSLFIVMFYALFVVSFSIKPLIISTLYIIPNVIQDCTF